eukprot:CAMPEP_0179011572 /NCGR_PEP_ID=MMETSP0796-20121207/736_1 /TAXON_ID=73915 /ORGANISM="Pyrodinium bahamense, Strain pbaha01" /LENGTH=235 /DNA_ID=CAMNT_0020706961 /DNA_START=20 /DNA_END=727 /DNA_ORIENTATION=-
MALAAPNLCRRTFWMFDVSSLATRWKSPSDSLSEDEEDESLELSASLLPSASLPHSRTHPQRHVQEVPTVGDGLPSWELRSLERRGLPRVESVGEAVVRGRTGHSQPALLPPPRGCLGAPLWATPSAAFCLARHRIGRFEPAGSCAAAPNEHAGVAYEAPGDQGGVSGGLVPALRAGLRALLPSQPSAASTERASAVPPWALRSVCEMHAVSSMNSRSVRAPSRSTGVMKGFLRG